MLSFAQHFAKFDIDNKYTSKFAEHLIKPKCCSTTRQHYVKMRNVIDQNQILLSNCRKQTITISVVFLNGDSNSGWHEIYRNSVGTNNKFAQYL